MNISSTSDQLLQELSYLRSDIDLMRETGSSPDAVRRRELKALEVAMQLKAECHKVIQ